MDTVIEKIDEDNIDMHIIRQAAQIIKSGGLVAFPTETVYGLGADALNEKASAKIYEAKGRPSDNPLIAHIADIGMLDELVLEVPEKAKKLMDAFWPGPMTLIFKKSNLVPMQTTGGLDTIAVRFPSHKIARALIKEAGVSIAAPSANLSGKPSPTLGEHVIEDMNGRIDMILDGGMVQVGLESTIIDVTEEIPMILRPGFITKEMLDDVIGDVQLDTAILNKPTAEKRPKAPGMMYRHYAPKADYRIYRGEEKKVAKEIIRLANETMKNGHKSGVITIDEHLDFYKDLDKEVMIVSLGTLKKPETIARRIFKTLRDFDKENVEYIFGEAFSENDVGQAIMNRLMKAAGYNVFDL